MKKGDMIEVRQNPHHQWEKRELIWKSPAWIYHCRHIDRENDLVPWNFGRETGPKMVDQEVGGANSLKVTSDIGLGWTAPRPNPAAIKRINGYQWIDGATEKSISIFPLFDEDLTKIQTITGRKEAELILSETAIEALTDLLIERRGKQ